MMRISDTFEHEITIRESMTGYETCKSVTGIGAVAAALSLPYVMQLN